LFASAGVERQHRADGRPRAPQRHLLGCDPRRRGRGRLQAQAARLSRLRRGVQLRARRLHDGGGPYQRSCGRRQDRAAHRAHRAAERERSGQGRGETRRAGRHRRAGPRRSRRQIGLLKFRCRPSKHSLLLLVACLCIATPCLSAPERFTTDRPSPLKLAKPAKEEGAAVEFRGQAQISGRFQVEWKFIAKDRGHLRALFFPDKDSTGLLPYAAGSKPVEELLIANGEQAVAILFEPATAQKILAKELLAAEGEASITIRDYRVVVECDHRWYMARLVAAAKIANMVAGVRQTVSVGC